MHIYKKKPHRLLNSGVSVSLDLEPTPCGAALAPLVRLGDCDETCSCSSCHSSETHKTSQLNYCLRNSFSATNVSCCFFNDISIASELKESN